MVAKALVYAGCLVSVAWALVTLFPGLQPDLAAHHLTGWLWTIAVFAGFAHYNGQREAKRSRR